MTTERLKLCACVGAGRRARRGGGRRLYLQLCATLLCVAVLLVSAPHCAVGQPTLPNLTVKLLMVNLTDLSFSTALVRSFHAGLEASLWSRNYIVADGVSVEFVKRECIMADYVKTVDDAMRDHNDILTLVGHFDDATLRRVMPALKRHDLVLFAPVTGSNAVRGWNPNVYFARPDASAELLALIRYAMNNLRVHRLGFMYLQNISFGDREYLWTKRALSELGVELSGVFTVESYFLWSADEKVFDAAWEQFADTYPQAVFVFGGPTLDTVKFVKRMLTDNRTEGAYLLAPSLVQFYLADFWRVDAAGEILLRPGQMITTGTNPMPGDVQYGAMLKFMDVIRVYLEQNKDKLEGEGIDLGALKDSRGELMVAGWIAGEMLSDALSSRKWLRNRTTFQRSLFKQRRYIVEDLVIGDYGGDCSEMAVSQGASCFCNQGGRTVYIKQLVEDFRAEALPEATLTIKSWDCLFNETMPLSPLNGLGIFPQDSDYASRAMMYIAPGIDAALKLGNDLILKTHELTLSIISLTMAAAHDALIAEMTARRVHAVAGVVTEAMLDVRGLTFIDPLQIEPRLNRFRRHVIRMSPTLEQELFVLAQYLGNTTGASAHAVVRVSEAASVADVLRRSLLTFDGSLLSTTLLAGGDALEGHLPREGNVFVVGLSAGDANVLARHLAAYGGVRVFVVFTELAVLYADFVAAFSGGTGADRLVFATSLPHWSDAHTGSVTAQKFMSAVRNPAQWTPLALMAFANTRLVQTVLSRMHVVSAELFADFFYKNVAVAVEGMLYGPFIDSPTHALNYGATSIAVWSLARVFNSSIPLLADPITPSMEYTDPNAGRLTGLQLIVIGIGSVLVTVLLVVIVIVLICCCRDSRDNRSAPREVTDPVTLLFTDIESSTALWAACPDAMPDAVATHHQLIRSLITKYRCYEVKTIGDSFMIACRSVFAAMQLVRELQQVFLLHDWGTTVIDDAYRVFEEKRAAEDEEYVPPTARLDAAVYRQYWNGLRVRIGVHTGLCDICHDTVTKGYDYYGATSNIAARTESVANGGQVLLTRAAYMALSTAEREEVDVTALGAVALRGVPRPVEMYQLDAVPGRTFAALRLEREAVDIDTGTESCGQSISSGSSNDMAGTRSTFLAVLLTELFNPLSFPQRQKMLETLCGRWGVPVPFKGSNNAADVSFSAICRLADKLTRVIARKAEIQGNGQDVGFSSIVGAIGTTGIANNSRGSLSFDVSAFPQPSNRMWINRGSMGTWSTESTTTIICHPPPSVFQL